MRIMCKYQNKIVDELHKVQEIRIRYRKMHIHVRIDLYLWNEFWWYQIVCYKRIIYKMFYRLILTDRISYYTLCYLILTPCENASVLSNTCSQRGNGISAMY